MPSLLRRVLCTALLFAAALVWTTVADAGVTVTTDSIDSEQLTLTWPQPETHNVIAVDGQPKIEIAPDTGVGGLYNYFLESINLTGGKVASQVFKPTTSFKLGAIGLYADGVGTFNTSTPALDDHIPLTVHLYELVSGTTGAGSLPTSYTLSTAGVGNTSAIDLFGGGNGLEFTYNGVAAFSYEFVELNFSGVDQAQLQADSIYAIEIRGNSITGAFNPQRLAPGGLGGTNPYPNGDSYDAANGTLTTARAQSLNRDLMIAIYEAIPTPTGGPGDFNLDNDVDGADFVLWQSNFPKASGATLGQGDADGDGDVDGADFVVWQTNFQSTTTPPSHAGDFDSDGDVDGADFVAWQSNFPKTANATLTNGDADGDGDVDGADFIVWQTNFPFTPGPGVAPVPEPGAFLIAALAIPAIARIAIRRRSRKC